MNTNDPAVSLDAQRQRHFRACAIGAAIALAVFFLFLVAGDPTRFFDRVPLGNFFEAQARAWLHARWDIPRAQLSAEAFIIDNKAYTYFGPWPAFLRLPFVLFTHGLDGRLARLSMLVAFALAMWATCRLAWQTRCASQGDSPLTRPELVLTAAFVTTVGIGSALVFLATRAWVFHEAIMWGVALVLTSLSYLIAFLQDGLRRSFVIAAVTGGLAFLSRPAIGAAPLAALGIILVARLISSLLAPREERRKRATRLLRELGISDRATATPVWHLLLAIAVPVTIYAYVNVSRFESLFGIPVDRQLILLQDAQRKAAVAANHGSLFGIKFAPTTLLAYWRPDAISIERLFPWFSFTHHTRVVGSAKFQFIEFYTSIPATALLLVVLTIIGVVVLVRARSTSQESGTAVFRLPILAAIIGGASALPVAYIAQRYEADFVPLLVLAGALGLQWVVRRQAVASARKQLAWRTGFALLAIWSVAAVTGTSLQYQHLYAPSLAMHTRADFVSTQIDVHNLIGGGRLPGTQQGPALPAPAAAGTHFVLGDCAGVYWSDGREWHPLELTPRTGLHRLRLAFDRHGRTGLQPVLVSGDNDAAALILVDRMDATHVRFVYQWTGDLPATFYGTTLTLPNDRTLDVSIVLDRAERLIQVRADGERVLTNLYAVPDAGAVLGRRDVPGKGARRFDGTIARLPVRAQLCPRVLGKV